MLCKVILLQLTILYCYDVTQMFYFDNDYGNNDISKWIIIIRLPVWKSKPLIYHSETQARTAGLSGILGLRT